MSFTPGTFYVQLEFEGHQYLAAFPSRAIADKYWRIVQGIDPRECRRHSAQNYAVSVLPNNLVQIEGWDSQMCLVRRVRNEHPVPVIPFDQRPDNINNASFYIRSTLRPKYYWYFNPAHGRVEISKARQSKFTITRTTGLKYAVRQEEDILIAEDDVTLSVTLNGGQGQAQRIILTRDQMNSLVPGNGRGSSFKFWLFENGFYGMYDQADGLVCAANRPEVGEKWEFVA